ncbi:hypothetical protein AMP9_3488 [plant metagenome]|uniref:Uncharacterized protein n=1 Tax=plant metagenome TaxID=1297885 RepID=A0A484P1C1_9ZZZZ
MRVPALTGIVVLLSRQFSARRPGAELSYHRYDNSRGHRPAATALEHAPASSRHRQRAASFHHLRMDARDAA